MSKNKNKRHSAPSAFNHSTCKVCRIYKGQVALKPCGHGLYCFKCVNKLRLECVNLRRPAKCPKDECFSPLQGWLPLKNTEISFERREFERRLHEERVRMFQYIIQLVDDEIGLESAMPRNLLHPGVEVADGLDQIRPHRRFDPTSWFNNRGNGRRRRQQNSNRHWRP